MNSIYGVVGTGIHNQGAELMAHAVHVAVSTSARAGPVIAASGRWSDEACRRNGLVPFRQIGGRLRGPLANVAIPKASRIQLEMFEANDINCMFDASGFLYSDQWGVHGAKRMRDRINAIVQRNGKYILLPQSFGPFACENLQQILRDSLPQASLVFAREKTSYRYLKELLDDDQNVRQAPDFTSTIAGLKSRLSVASKGCCLLIPNVRMLDKTSEDVSESYVHYFTELGQRLSKTRDVKVLSHCEEDLPLAKEISSSLGLENDQILHHRDPRIVKGIIGSAAVAIGSRYHALQAALSQGVIAFALGWSHKYPDLFDGYSWSQGVLDPLADIETTSQFVIDHLNDTKREHVCGILQERSEHLKQQTVAMWDEIFESLARR